MRRILLIVSFPIDIYESRFLTIIIIIIDLPLSPLFPFVSSTELSVSIINSPERHLMSLGERKKSISCISNK